MGEMTREQAYRRWKKGEDPHKLAKEMGVTRERMRHILKKMDASVPLVDRIEELEAAVDWQRGRAEAAEDKLAKAVCALHEIAGKKTYADDPWGIARTTLAELKGETDE